MFSKKEFKKAEKKAETLMARAIGRNQHACYIEIGESMLGDIHTNHVAEAAEELKALYERNGFTCKIRDDSTMNKTVYTLIIEL